jgi:hypothetical protein
VLEFAPQLNYFQEAPLPQLPVSVTCNLTGTFNASNGTWTGQQPAWTFNPDSVKVHNGQNNITWTLTATNIPTGFTAAFTDPGVAFKTSPQWTGGSPQNASGNQSVAASDNFQNLASTVKFRYTTSVTLTPNPGTGYSATTFTHDPDIENESGGGKR